MDYKVGNDDPILPDYAFLDFNSTTQEWARSTGFIEMEVDSESLTAVFYIMIDDTPVEMDRVTINKY